MGGMSGASEARAEDIQVHACGPGDRAEQVRLFNACFKKKVDERALVWRYDENPSGRALSFLSRPSDREGVSGYACSPRVAISAGDELRQAIIGETGDVMTHPEWRKKGLFSALDRACMQATEKLGWPIVFGLPNRRSAHIFVELGWRVVGSLRPWTFLLKSDAAARAERAKEGRLAGWLAPLGARRGRSARRALSRSGGARFTWREIEEFPLEVQELSRAVEPRFALMVRRDKRWLDWRFVKTPSGLHRALGVFDETGAFAGYAVIQTPRESEAVGYLVDVLARSDEAVAAALEAGLSGLEQCNASVVQATAIDGSWWSAKLRSANFLPPRTESHLDVIVYVHQPEHPLARAALDAKGWYLTDGDRDDETMG